MKKSTVVNLVIGSACATVAGIGYVVYKRKKEKDKNHLLESEKEKIPCEESPLDLFDDVRYIPLNKSDSNQEENTKKR